MADKDDRAASEMEERSVTIEMVGPDVDDSAAAADDQKTRNRRPS